MNVALIGYGKMGKEIERILKERGHDVVLVVDEGNRSDLNPANLKGRAVDVAVEFSTPETAFDNIVMCAKSGVPVVCGTTGWLDRFEQAQAVCEEYGGALFYASNYSVGVNVMFRINEALAKMMDRFGQYDVTIEEVHHTQKQDAPSGTAITIAEGILANVERKQKWIGSTTTEPDELEVVSIRRSVVPGTHTVTYESDIDQITLTHVAKSRQGLAMGAVMAAEFLNGKKGVYTMRDLLGF